ncbi:MAG: MCP four helix bundle domain-containing protein [Blautia marasmi]
MKNLKISKKLIISYAVILLFLITGMAVSIVNLVDFSKQLETFYDGPFFVKGSADMINSNFERMQKAVYRSIANEEEAITGEAIEDAKESAKIIQEQLPIVKEHFLGDKQIITRLEEQFTKLAPMRQQVLELAAQNKPGKRQHIWRPTIFPP